LEQDLARRDLTINAMAQDLEDPNRPIIDPYGGQTDLKDKQLRHVTEAFREDPVRILRLARFAARFAGFEVAIETLKLSREMVRAGEVDALVPERVWQEIERGLMAKHPLRMAQVLMDCGAWQRLWPELNANDPDHKAALAQLNAKTHTASSLLTLGQRWALWCHGGTPDQVAAIGERFRVPTAVQDMAWAWATHRHALAQSTSDAAAACELLYRMDALRRPERVQGLIELAKLISLDDRQIQVARCWQSAMDALLSVDAKAVNRDAQERGLSGMQIGLALKQAHTTAIAEIGV
jgi:tRNA nucleotidyltransferase (CCA-adding enzyme)